MAQTIKRASDNKGATETAAKTGSKKAQNVVQTASAGDKKSALGYRIGAIALWLVAIGCEVLAIMALLKDFAIRFTRNGNTNMLITLILFIVLDLIFAIIAAQLWKKANHINPPSEKNKFTFYLISEFGVIMACICFIPLIIILLKNDKLDKKTKTIASIVAIVALLITGGASADFNPISAEQKTEAENVFNGTSIYWTPFGHKYHMHYNADDPDDCCGAIRNSATIYEGDITESIESGRTSVCSYCRNWWDKQVENGVEGFSAIDWTQLNIEADVVDGE
ncbi:MAG: hypothetical protein II072_01065 [Clostridia bacterium]|nr:hypothetical protein [Clostridia bacterium]